VKRQIVPDGGTRNRKRPPADCIDDQAELPYDVRYRMPWMNRYVIIASLNFEGDTFWDAQTVKVDERWGNV